MAEENVILEAPKGPNRRNIGRKRKKPKRVLPDGVGGHLLKPKKIDGKMKKLFRKRARDYNSDEEEEESGPDKEAEEDKEEHSGGYSSEEEEEEDGKFDDGFLGDEEDGEIQPGITKFTEGCRAFRMAFKSITKKSVQDDGLGPVLSAHKKLVAEKLAEEEAERKVKGEAKKEKHLVNKAQNAQKGLDPSRSKDAKVLRKRRKEAFFSELGKRPVSAANTPAMVQSSTGQADGEAPAWAPLRDNYMLTNSKLKDWDKMPDTSVADDLRRMSEASSSDDDD
ncbi:Rrp15p protein [Parasponia andersonii]|uniref:Rrp15p protein n=1 Tax=Parasponia andersonii TaxID=3476 RepID=A0A2P5BV60_PARAD|nr:Rrp15p protein [Parasponia andersonii]